MPAVSTRVCCGNDGRFAAGGLGNLVVVEIRFSCCRDLAMITKPIYVSGCGFACTMTGFRGGGYGCGDWCAIGWLTWQREREREKGGLVVV